MEELGYLANVLLAGCSFAGRSFRPFEAVEAVVATCNLGLEHLLEAAPDEESDGAPSQRAAATLAREGADKLFRAGWHLLHTGVSLVAAGALSRALARRLRETVDRDDAARLTSVARRVSSAVAEGKPWLARRTLDVLGDIFDASTITTLEALLDECPSIPEETGPQRRAFVATEEQLLRAQRLLGNLSCTGERRSAATRRSPEGE